MGKEQEYVIAVTRWNVPPDSAIAPVSHLLGLTPGEMRDRIRAPLPAIMGYVSDEPTASEILETLLDAGHSAVACDCSRVVCSMEEKVWIRTFQLEDKRIVVLNEQGRLAIPYRDMLALIDAQHAESTRPLQRVLYVYCTHGRDTVLLGERTTRYDGLPDSRAASARDNYVATVAELRRRAAQVHYDERLLSQVRPPVPAGVQHEREHDTRTAGNTAATDLAAHLLALAFRQNQA